MSLHPYPYSLLLDHSSLIFTEFVHPYEFLTERHLHVLWLEQKYFYDLFTLNKERVEVISPGIWNTGAGPDFLKAHLLIDGRECRGDVELHLADAGWEHHKHHLDKAYDHVVLHISLWPSPTEKILRNSRGDPIPQLYLHDFLTIPHARILRLVDLDLYPYRRFVGSGHCAQSLFRNLSKTKTEQFFQSAADWRLSQKRAYLQGHFSFSFQQLLGGMAMTLGYKHNGEVFLKLFPLLAAWSSQTEKSLLAFCLKACGFFHDAYFDKWKESEYYRELHAIGGSSSSPLPLQELQLGKSRPLNHPIRRLAYLIKLAKDPATHVLYDRMVALWQQAWADCNSDQAFRSLVKQLQALIPQYEDDYWNSHYLFETERQEAHLTLIGKSLKREMFVNAFLPLLHHHVKREDQPKERTAFNRMYHTLESAETGKSRYLKHRFFGETPKGNLLKKTEIQQGAYQLHRDFCVHYEASCKGCPFVEKYQKVFT
jgi:hypothetical protein